MKLKKIISIGMAVVLLSGTTLISGCQTEKENNKGNDSDVISEVVSVNDVSSEESSSKESSSKKSSSKESSSKKETPEKTESEKPTETSSKEASSEKIVEVKDKIVEITLSKEFLELGGSEANYTLTQEQKDNGFIDIIKNNDGSATYTIKEKDYKVFIVDLKKEATNGIDEITDGTFTSIKSVSYNDDLSEITIVADKEAFNGSFDSLSMMSCSLNSLIYQRFDVNAKGKCTVKVKDSASGEVFKTKTYPEN